MMTLKAVTVLRYALVWMKEKHGRKNF